MLSVFIPMSREISRYEKILIGALSTTKTSSGLLGIKLRNFSEIRFVTNVNVTRAKWGPEIKHRYGRTVWLLVLKWFSSYALRGRFGGLIFIEAF